MCDLQLPDCGDTIVTSELQFCEIKDLSCAL